MTVVSAVGTLAPSRALREISSVLELPTAMGGLMGGLAEIVLLDHSEIRFEVVHGLGNFVHLIGEVPYRIVFLVL